MKGFSKFKFDANELANESTALIDLLKIGEGISLKENEHLSPALKAAPNHVSIIASSFCGVNKPDLIASEYWILDKLRCDFAVCDSRRRKFCFIEIEDANPRSIFVERKPDQYNGLMGRAPYYDWSERFEHGASQIIDWIRVLHDAEKTDDFRAHFGPANRFEAEFILVIGRDEYLDSAQKERLTWRTKNLKAGDYKIRCITFDQVVEEGKYELETYTVAANVAASTHNQ
ncbi:Shedu anti-phage system protein SduA domain-containing protein [Enterobacter roggenkampii]|uniref:DUF4263 domain-containing protein n=1 Tax=Enterobacter roggenkampii TaxID=1812935 RepID=A0ABD7GPW7_9ENTR|nr:Shedu anti-phage system protein SduA domain-containing protein [Enterobacter roggenkampii]EHF8251990.1 DUF4263 domain-containing protein [Enterobacter roggenkampii]MBA7742634.1 DUF4263 domain-containing protein [Enterobacter roggenkampii]MBT2027776.1 DUF4263 domain-containing protein [Enterobacter roggenkampii]MBT2032237.1 DUF4263 domain-containing protein [Enterobacter roggenkampii]MCM7636193.1 DUF4263 domain-containing protein [Enterobacter roggenkampii]